MNVKQNAGLSLDETSENMFSKGKMKQLQAAIDFVLEQLVREGKITKDEAKQIRKAYDVKQISQEAEATLDSDDGETESDGGSEEAGYGIDPDGLGPAPDPCRGQGPVCR